MIVIQSIDDKYFSLNGIQFAKIYQPLAQGSEAIGLYSIYDTKQQLLNSTNYSEFEIDGVSYTSQEDTIAALLDVIYSGISASDLQDRIKNLEENQVTGVQVYSNFQDRSDGRSFLPPTGTLLVSYKVADDAVDSSLNGFYHWGGSAYIKDDDPATQLRVDVDKIELNKENSIFEIITTNQTDIDKIEVIKKAISSIYIDGTYNSSSLYSLAVFSNNSSYRRIRIFEKNGVTTTEILNLTEFQGSPKTDIETIVIPEFSSSGYEAKVLIDWSQAQNVDYLNLFEDDWIIKEKVFSESIFNYSLENKGKIETAESDILSLESNVQANESDIEQLQNDKIEGYSEITTPSETQLDQIKTIRKAIVSIWIDGTVEAGYDYSIPVFRNDSSFRIIRIFKTLSGVDTEICNLTIAQGSPKTDIETIVIPEFSSSGYEAKVLIDWSQAENVSYSNLFEDKWKLTYKVFSESYFKYDIQNKSNIDNANEKKTESLFSDIDIMTLLNWSKVGDVLQSQSSGWSNYAYFDADLNEDKFKYSAKIKAVNVGDFEIGIGKRANTSGTAITLRKTSSNSYLEIYKMVSSSSPTVSLILRQTLTDALENDKEYLLSMAKDVNQLSIELIYPDSTKKFEFSTSDYGETGFSWGYPSLFCITGQAEVSEINFSMPYERNRDPKILVFGDSFIEGNSIPDDKTERYCALLASELGELEVVNMGKGGESTISVLDRIYTQIDWFKDAKFALIALGTNDSNFTTYQNNLSAIIAYLNNYDIVPILVTVTYDAATDNSAFIAQSNPYIRSLGQKFIDVSKAVSIEGDETTWKSGLLLPDNVHPTIAGHLAIFNRIKYDASYLFK